MAQMEFHAKEPNRIPHKATLTGWYIDPDMKNDDGTPAKWQMELTFHPVTPFGDLNRVLRAFGTMDGSMVLNGLDIQRFLVESCTDDCGPDFAALLESNERAVDVETLGALTMWLIGEYTGRPSTR